MSQLAERYAAALFELASETNKIVEWQIQAKVIQQSLTQDMNKFFASCQISKDDKKNVLKKAYTEVLDAMMLDFLYLLIDKSRFNNVNAILLGFNTLCNNSRNVKEGIIYSARPLNKEQISKIENAMSNKINADCELINKVDPRLISGFKVEIDNVVIDSSMKNRLLSMKHELLRETR